MNVKPEKIKDPAGGTKKIDDFWGPAQKHLLGDPNLLKKLMEYDRDNMGEEMVAKAVSAEHRCRAGCNPHPMRCGCATGHQAG